VRVDGDYAGRIEFLKFLMSNFRRRAFDWLVRSASADARYAGDPMQQQLLLAPLAQAVHRHLKTYPDPYLEELAIDESSMGIKGELDRKTFQDAWKRIIDTEPVITTPLPPIHLHDLGRTADQASGFMEASLGTGREKILVDQIQALTQNLGDLLAHSLHIQDWRNPPTPENWVKSLVAQDLSQADPAVKELSTSALNFFKAMMSADSSRPFFIPDTELNPYNVMRLYAVAFDRAIYRLAWGKATQFLIEGLQIAVGDISKGQSPGVQHFLFEGRSSPLSAMDLGLVLGNAKYQPFFDELEGSEPRHHQRFTERCTELIKELAK
jgi:hypothetical protein